ncbi:hypothetical protein [Thauera humireducens]|uniref:hypothetical protein n=1 Tax=Thauera humireducens TaxID=1134435 RepID=UPI00312023C8
MAAGPITLYQANLDDMRMQDLLSATVKLSLHTPAYTPSAGTSGHSVAADLTNELPTAAGYTAGGATLTGKLVTAVTGGWKFESDDAAWNASGGNIPAWRYGVLRVDGALWGKTSPLIGYFVGDTTPADVPATSDGSPLTVACPANGWFDSKVA